MRDNSGLEKATDPLATTLISTHWEGHEESTLADRTGYCGELHLTMS